MFFSYVVMRIVIIIINYCFVEFVAKPTPPPSLGLLVSSLKETCDGYFVAVETVEQLQKKVDGIRNMTSEEMKQVKKEGEEE